MDRTMHTAFSADAWNRNARVYEVIRTMPFNAALAAGTLSEARFKHYITQDAHYLIGFGRALTLAGAKAPNPDRIVQFAKSAEGAIVVERALHGSFFQQYGITLGGICADAALTGMSSLCFISARDRLRGTLRSAARRAAALLLDLCRGGTRHPLSRRRRQSVPGLDRHLCRGRVPQRRSRHDCRHRRSRRDRFVIPRERMHAAFVRATQLEWMFWDSAFRLESWPI